MKKLISLMLVLASMLTVASCVEKDNGGDKPDTDKNQTKIESWVGHSYDKIRIDERKPEGAASEYTVYAAKGETEGCSLGLWSEEATGAMRIKLISGKNDNVVHKFYRVRKGDTYGRKVYTDPAVPTSSGEPFALEAKKSAAFLVEFTTTKDTPAGEYVYEVGFTDTSGKVVVKHKITLHVWDFELPEEKTFETTVNYDQWPLIDYYGILLEHNMCGQRIPVDVLTEEADAYLNNPKVTTFRILVDWSKLEKRDPEELARLDQIYKKLKTNPDWLAKAYFYVYDEPRNSDHLTTVATRSTILKEICPEIRITSAFYTNVSKDGKDQLDYMAQYLDLHCPKLSLWDDGTFASNFGDRMAALQQKGDGIWAYVCNYPLAPYLNIKLTDDGLSSRVLFWQFYQRNIEGLLYWHSDYWDKLPNQNPWESLDAAGDGILGDGILTYPGEKIDRTGPIASIRLKIIRDGIDDIEYMYLAEQVLGESWAKEKAAIVSKSLQSLDVTSDEFAALRIEIGNALENALKK